MLERTDRRPTRFKVMIGFGYADSNSTQAADASSQSEHRTLLAAWRRLGSWISGKRRSMRGPRLSFPTRFYIEDDNGRRYTWSEARHILRSQGRI